MEVSRVQEEVLVTSSGGKGPHVTSYLQLQPNQRFRETLNLRAHPVAVRHRDTVWAWPNGKSRYRSTAFYQPRLRPKTWGLTTFTYPRHAEPRYVSHADFGGGRKDNKWFKTVVEMKGDPNRIWKSTKDITLSSQQDLNQNYISVQESCDSEFVLDDGPGASQVYIPGYKFLGVRVQHAQ